MPVLTTAAVFLRKRALRRRPVTKPAPSASGLQPAVPLFQNAAYYKTVSDLTELPPAQGMEIAFAGRSNSGKSSAINALANHKRLAYVSKTPGRTQHINFFRLAPHRFLVDLPGYGYAKVPARAKRHWEALLSTYLQTRDSLQGLVLIVDARHPLTVLDRQMLDWFLPTGKPVHVLLTKADKLSRQETVDTLGRVQALLQDSYPGCNAQLFSSATRIGVAQAQRLIESWLNEGPKIKTPG